MLRSIGGLGLLTGVAYTASIVRDAILAAYYGGSAALDIYYIALAPTQFLGMEIASLGYLVFLPEFVRSLKGREDSPAGVLFRQRLAWVVTGTIGAALVLTLIASAFTSVIAPGYSHNTSARVVRWTFACLSLLIPILGVVGVLRAFLEAQGRFRPWALLPALRSLGLGAVVILAGPGSSVAWLIVGSLVGAGAGLLYSWNRARTLPSYPEGLGGGRRFGQLPASLFPLITALVVWQLTVIVDNAFASGTGVGGVQAFSLASNLLAIPQALITGVVATVYFPVYGSHLSAGNRAGAMASLRGSIRLVVWSSLPVVLLFCTNLGTYVAKLIYHRGAFDLKMVSLVSQTAAGLSLGLAPYACMVLMRQYFLADQRPWLAFHTAAVFCSVKLLGNVVLTSALGVPGIALSSTLAATFSCVYLAIRMRGLASNATVVPAGTPIE